MRLESTKRMIESTFHTDDYNLCVSLLAYVQYVLMNGRILDWNKLSMGETELMQDWIDDNIIYYQDDKIYMYKTEYDQMCDILFDTYVDFYIMKGEDNE